LRTTILPLKLRSCWVLLDPLS